MCTYLFISSFCFFEIVVARLARVGSGSLTPLTPISMQDIKAHMLTPNGVVDTSLQYQQGKVSALFFCVSYTTRMLYFDRLRHKSHGPTAASSCISLEIFFVWADSLTWLLFCLWYFWPAFHLFFVFVIASAFPALFWTLLLNVFCVRCCVRLLDGIGSVCTASGNGGYGGAGHHHHLLAHSSSPLPGSTCLIQQQHQCTTTGTDGQMDMTGGGFCAAVYRTTAQTPAESPQHPQQHNLHQQQEKAARILSSPPPAASAPTASSRSASALTLLQPIAAAAVSYTLPSLMAPYPNSTASGE